jgi:hypothetical protein
MRGFWIAFTLLGAVICTIVAAFMFYVIIVQYQEIDEISTRGIIRAGFVTVLGCAFASALFMKPREIRKVMEPEEEKPAPWIEEMRQDAGPTAPETGTDRGSAS